MSAPGAAPVRLPKTIAGYVWRKTRHQQALLSLLAVATFLLNTAPLELQRRIVNDAIKNGNLRAILLLSAAYAGLALLQGAVKLTLNIYGAYVSENTSRSLRRSVYGMLTGLPGDGENGTDVRRGIEISMIVDEVDDVGSFVGISVAQPVQQVGILLSVLGYLAFLEPTMALLSLLIFLPQLAFVPVMQGAINRRARDRINTLRQISAGIVADDDAVAASTAEQHARIGHVFTLNMGIFKLKFTMNFLMNLQYHIGIAAGLALGGWYAVQGTIEVGTIVAFISGLAKANDPWGETINWYREMMVVSVKYRLISATIEKLTGAAPAAAQGGTR